MLSAQKHLIVESPEKTPLSGRGIVARTGRLDHEKHGGEAKIPKTSPKTVLIGGKYSEKALSKPLQPC